MDAYTHHSVKISKLINAARPILQGLLREVRYFIWIGIGSIINVFLFEPELINYTSKRHNFKCIRGFSFFGLGTATYRCLHCAALYETASFSIDKKAIAKIPCTFDKLVNPSSLSTKSYASGEPVCCSKVSGLELEINCKFQGKHNLVVLRKSNIRLSKFPSLKDFYNVYESLSDFNTLDGFEIECFGCKTGPLPVFGHMYGFWYCLDNQGYYSGRPGSVICLSQVHCHIVQGPSILVSPGYFDLPEILRTGHYFTVLAYEGVYLSETAQVLPPFKIMVPTANKVGYVLCESPRNLYYDVFSPYVGNSISNNGLFGGRPTHPLRLTPAIGQIPWHSLGIAMLQCLPCEYKVHSQVSEIHQYELEVQHNTIKCNTGVAIWVIGEIEEYYFCIENTRYTAALCFHNRYNNHTVFKTPPVWTWYQRSAGNCRNYDETYLLYDNDEVPTVYIGPNVRTAPMVFKDGKNHYLNNGEFWPSPNSALIQSPNPSNSLCGCWTTPLNVFHYNLEWNFENMNLRKTEREIVLKTFSRLRLKAAEVPRCRIKSEVVFYKKSEDLNFINVLLLHDGKFKDVWVTRTGCFPPFHKILEKFPNIMFGDSFGVESVGDDQVIFFTKN